MSTTIKSVYYTQKFVEEYALYLLEELNNCELMRSDIREQKQTEILRVLNLYRRNYITVDETMRTLSNI